MLLFSWFVLLLTCLLVLFLIISESDSRYVAQFCSLEVQLNLKQEVMSAYFYNHFRVAGIIFHE